MTASRRGFVVACAFGIAAGWNVANVGAIASTMARSYDVGLATVGLLTSALFVTHTAVLIPGGRANDRFGATTTGAIAMGIMCAGALLGMTAADPAVGIVARAVTGCGTGLAFVSGVALVRESGGSPFAQGLFGGIALGAGGLALAFVPQIAGDDGWRTPYWTSGACAVAALALLVVLRVRSTAERLPSRADGLAAGVIGDRRLHRLAIIFAASYGFSVVLANWVIELLERHLSSAGALAAAIGSLTLMFGVVTRPLGGWILRRYPDRARETVAASLAAGGVGALMLVVADSGAVAAAGAALLGIGAGIPFAPAFTGAALVRPDAPAAAVGVVNTVANFTILVSTPLVGLTFGLPGDGRLGFAVVGVLWLAALAVVPRTVALAPAAAR